MLLAKKEIAAQLIEPIKVLKALLKLESLTTINSKKKFLSINLIQYIKISKRVPKKINNGLLFTSIILRKFKMSFKT